MAAWPWPRDTTQDRLKRIIDSYRTALKEVDPTACGLVDARMCEYGQSWVCSDQVVDVNEKLSAPEIARRFGINAWNIHDWSRRHPDLIPRLKDVNGKTVFRLGDVLAYQRDAGKRR